MATYTLPPITFTAAQEAAFDMKLFEWNQSRATQTPPLPPVTKQQYLEGLIARLPQQWLTEFRSDLGDRIAQALQTATVATLQTVCTTLGVDSNPYD